MDITIHASAVALSGRGVLICGAAGSGKSSLALALMARGGALVADDRTCLRALGDQLIASAPEPILGLIEARGIGLLRVAAAPPTSIALVVDLDAEEAARLPEPMFRCVAGVRLPLVRGAGMAHLADAMVQFLPTLDRITA